MDICGTIFKTNAPLQVITIYSRSLRTEIRCPCSQGRPKIIITHTSKKLEMSCSNQNTQTTCQVKIIRTKQEENLAELKT